MKKQRHLSSILGFLLLAVVLLSGWYYATPLPQSATDLQLRAVLDQAGITPFDPGLAPEPAKVVLGQALFFDKILSGRRDISCATCHHPLLNTSDGLPLSIGMGAAGLGPTRVKGFGRDFVPRNAPEIFNRGAPEWASMFWDSRVSGSPTTGFTTPAGQQLPDGLESVLAAQALFPVTSRGEMRGARGEAGRFGIANELAPITDDDLTPMWNALIQRVLAIPEYQAMFQAAYPNTPADQLGFQHAANAIAAFEIEAFTFTDSPWDRYVVGNDTVLSEEAKQGALLFYGKAGCSRCHAGNLFTDQQHHNIGVPQLGPGTGGEAPLDLGLYRETGNAADKYKFRTPPLRNVALTGPWLHNGAYASLRATVEHHYLNPEAVLRNYDASQLPTELQQTVQTNPAIHTDILVTLDELLRNPVPLTDTEVDQIMAFLESLTSSSAFYLPHDIPQSVPSGLPVAD